jgi:hypothetical protein
MSESTMEMVHKVTLSSGKVVMLREMKIKHQTLATQAVGSKAGDNQLLMATLMQQELLKTLLVNIDGRPVSGQEREDLDSLFSYVEYNQLSRVIGQIAGGDAGECKTEIATIGKQ